MPTTYFTSESVYKGHIAMGVDGNDTGIRDAGIMFDAVEALHQEVNCVFCCTL